MIGPMGKALGMGSKPMPGADEEEGDSYTPPEAEEETAGAELPPGFESAYADFTEAPSAQGLYDLIELCKSGGESDEPGGLSLILGGKGKEP